MLQSNVSHSICFLTGNWNFSLFKFLKKTQSFGKSFPVCWKACYGIFPLWDFSSIWIWSLVFCLHSPLEKNKRHFLCRSSLSFYQDRKCTSVHAFECLEWISCSVQVQFHFITNLTHCDHLVSKEQKASHQLSDYSSPYSGLQITFARRRWKRNNSLLAHLSRTVFKKEVKKD